MTMKNSKLIISENMLPVINFIEEIDKEIEDLFYFSDNQSILLDGYKQLIAFSKFSYEELKKRQISTNKYPLDLVNKVAKVLVQHEQPVRCQMIAIFAYMEALFVIHLAYAKNVSSLISIKKEASDDRNKKRYINLYLLSDENDYYKQHKKLKRLDSTKLIYLRNILTHFFSVTDQHIVINSESTKTIEDKFYSELKKQKMGGIVNVSPKELLLLVREAGLLMVEKWSEDSKDDNIKFNRNINFVQKVVHQHAAIIISQKELSMILDDK